MENSNEKEVLLRVEHLCQYFGGTKAVDDVSFDIKKGEVFGLVGESGCGKTTTGRSIIKLYDITSGDVYFKGIRICAGLKSYQDAIEAAKQQYKDRLAAEPQASYEQKTAWKKERDMIVAAQKTAMKSAKEEAKNCDKEYQKREVARVEAQYAGKLKTGDHAVREEYHKALAAAKKTRLVTQIQMIFQDPIASLDPRMTVREIIAEGLIVEGEKDKKVIDEKVFEMLEMVGLVREHASRYPHEFSGGQKQRVGVARSIIMHPELIIADEPVSALDVSIQAQVINLLNELREKMNLTLLFIAHDLSVVKYFSDRIGVMYYGHMVEMAPSDELFLNPLHPYTRALLSAIPLPDPQYEKQRRRIVYNPLADHDYSVDKPSFREVKPGHFVSCNEAEYQAYKARLK